MKLEFHHINFVSADVKKMHEFYTNVLGLDNIPIENFPRPPETEKKGYNGEIKFDSDKPDGAIRKILDSSYLNRLGWKYTYTIDEALKLTYKWYLENYC